MKVKAICPNCGSIYYKRLSNTKLCQDCRIKAWREKNKASNTVYLAKLPHNNILITLLKQYTDKEIAEKYNVSRSAVNRKRNKLKGKFNK
jgi:FixJ family two-component response regulator